MVRPVDTDREVLGMLDGVRCTVAVTSEPWLLGVEALVISAGPDGFGELGRDVRRHVPGVPWGELRLGDLTPDRPQVLAVPPSTRAPTTSQWIVVASARDTAQGRQGLTGDFPGTPEAARRGAGSAVRAAAARDAASLALPLLGAGAIGLSLEVAAEATVTGVRRALAAVGPSSIGEVVFVGRDDATADAVRVAWRQAEPVPQTTSSSTSGPSDSSAYDPGGSGAGSDWDGELLPAAEESEVQPPDDVSASTREALEHALALAAARGTPGAVDPDLVLVGVLIRARGQGSTAGGLLQALAGDIEQSAFVAQLASAVGVPVDSLFVPVPVGDGAVADGELLEAARAIRARLGSPVVRRRHLLAAVVTADPPLSAPALAALGVTAQELRRRLRAVLADSAPTEAPDVWDDVLGVVTDATWLAGGMDPDAVDGGRGIPLDRDHLGLATYVGMLASVIARRDTPLPLSVGLFGEWGSGKSYFMGLLREQVAELGRSGDEAYLKETVQITFNAWHYADSNLWASLGNEIFEQLAGPGESSEQRRETLRAELSEKMQRAQDLKEANRQAEQETTRLRAELDRARTDQAGSARTLVTAVVGSEDLRARLPKVWQQLGIAEEVEQGRLLAEELRQGRADVDVLRLATKGRRGWTLVVLAALALVALASAALLSGAAARWLAAGGLGGLAAATAGVTAVVARVRGGLDELSKVAADIRANVVAHTETALAEDVQRLRQADAHEAVLQAQLREVLQRVGELGRELAALSPGQRWYGFVSERAASQDYRKELGLISTIRRDFERLVELMKDWAERPDPDEQHRPIERIVLYIDDLDRCSPKQVVDVLQAVHLLLALDLFVVVVGVDPRWLLHSLREQYRSIFESRPDGHGRTHPDLIDDEQVWRTTPHDYLEKIFNIPFVLPGMTTASFEELIRQLSRAPDPPPSAAPAPVEEPSSQAPGAAASASGSEEADTGSLPDPPPDAGALARPVLSKQGLVPADVPAQENSEVAAIRTGDRPVPRQLTEPELALLGALGPLVRSPRQAKRLLNLYRLVRSTRDLTPASQFLGTETAPGEFQAVCVLLGLLTAHPRPLGQLLAAEPVDGVPGGLCHRDGTQRWADVVAGLSPVPWDGGYRNDVAPSMSESERQEWEDLVRRVEPATALVGLPDLAAFRLWGPRVARFSFLLSPLAGTDLPATAPGRPVR